MNRHALARRLARFALQRALRGAFTALGLLRVRARAGDCIQIAEARTVCIVRLDLLGDVLHTLTMADSVRACAPQARITMVTLPYTAPLARLSPSVDEVIEVDTNRVRSLRGLIDPRTWIHYARSWRRLRAQDFDIAVSVYGGTGSLVTALLGARRTTGYQVEAYCGTLSDPVPGGRHVERKHEVEYVNALAAHLGCVPTDQSPLVIVPAVAQIQTHALLESAGVRDGEHFVLIHAGSINGSAKRWPVESWAAFVDALQENHGIRCVFAGAASDGGIVDAIARHSRTAVTSFTGKTDVVQLAALIERADLVASGDSGPLHLAVALHRPVLAVYGPTDPVIYGPHRPRAATILLRTDLPCSPCYSLAATAECPLGDPICMRLVPVARMVDAAVQLLEPSNEPMPV